MTVKIESLGVVIPGQVVRKFDGTNTTLTITAEQAKALFVALSTVNEFFDLQEQEPDAP